MAYPIWVFSTKSCVTDIEEIGKKRGKKSVLVLTGGAKK